MPFDAAQTSYPTLHAQADRLVALGYPGLAGLDEAAFRALVAPLERGLDRLMSHEHGASDRRPAPAGEVPFLLVVTRDLVRPELTVPLLRLAGSDRPGRVDHNHAEGDLATYHPLEDLDVPSGPVYLLTGVQRGEEFCGVRPEEALPVIRSRGRTPLTIDEGIALVTQVPEALERNRCFMLSGSRREDRRVPALWISARAPRLGWCGDGNPHDWLGVASAAGRIGP